jgi:ribonuclease J
MDTAGIVQANVLQERQRLAEDGMVTVAAVIGTNGQLLAEPEVHLRGVVTSVGHDKWRTWVKECMELALRNRWEHYVSQDKNGIDVDWDGLKSHIEKELHGLLRRELQTRASLLFLMQHPQTAQSVANRVIPQAQQVKSEEFQTPTRRQRSTAKVAAS